MDWRLQILIKSRHPPHHHVYMYVYTVNTNIMKYHHAHIDTYTYLNPYIYIHIRANIIKCHHTHNHIYIHNHTFECTLRSIDISKLRQLRPGSWSPAQYRSWIQVSLLVSRPPPMQWCSDCEDHLEAPGRRWRWCGPLSRTWWHCLSFRLKTMWRRLGKGNPLSPESIWIFGIQCVFSRNKIETKHELPGIPVSW